MAEAVVVDASVAAKWVIRGEEHDARAFALLRAFFLQGIDLVAPALIRYELGHALEKAHRRGRVPAGAVLDGMAYFLNLGIHDEADRDSLLEHALRVAQQLGASVYDAVYVAYAQERQLELVSTDRRLIERARRYKVATRHLSEIDELL